MLTVPDPDPASLRLIPVAKDARRFSRRRHSHPWAHLIYATRGVVSVTTEAGTWVAPPNRAIWVPSGVEHATRSHGPVRFRSFIAESGTKVGLPAACCVMEMSDLARALIVRLDTTLSPPRPENFTERAARLLLDELGVLPTEPLSLRMPHNPQLARFCVSLRVEPSRMIAIEKIAGRLGMSRSTFMRHFRHETGMTFGRWCQQARLLKSLTLLAKGESILNVALDCGYQSPSAFAAVFRRTFGKAPSAYFD